MPPQSPAGLSGVQVLPSSSETESRAGYRPDQTMRRLFPWTSTTPWIVGVSSEVAQFSGTERRSDHVKPPFGLRFKTIAPRPWPLDRPPTWFFHLQATPWWGGPDIGPARGPRLPVDSFRWKYR